MTVQYSYLCVWFRNKQREYFILFSCHECVIMSMPFLRKLYVCTSVVLCLFICTLILFFLFPRSVSLSPVALKSSYVFFTPNTVQMNLTVGGINSRLSTNVLWGLGQGRSRACGLWPSLLETKAIPFLTSFNDHLSKQHAPDHNLECHSKGSEYLCKCELSVFDFSVAKHFRKMFLLVPMGYEV